MATRPLARPFLPILLLAAACSEKPVQPPDVIPAEHLERVLASFNRGVGLMDRYQPAEAAEAFAEVVALAPGWITGRVDLGIALLNSQTDDGYARAEQELLQVRDAAPDNPYANYGLGVLQRHQGRNDEARASFERVLKVDPDDADTHYELGILTVDREPAVAREHFERTLAAVPHHESACYRLFTVLQQAGESERAAEYLQRFSELKRTGSGVVSAMKYGEMGRYAEVVRVPELPAEPGDRAAAAPSWNDVAAAVGLDRASDGAPGWPGDDVDAIRRDGAAAFRPGLAVADVDGDGSLDLYVTGVDGGGALYSGAGGRFTELRQSGIDGAGAVGAYFGDYDRDGDPDLYLTCAGPDRLYRNDGSARFVDVTAASGMDGRDTLGVGAAWVDADHDGDLDLYVANFCVWPLPADRGIGAPNVLWRNDGSGHFRDVAEAAGIDGGAVPTIGVAVFDADGDGDLDVYLIQHRAANRLFLNDRIGRYSPAPPRYAILEDAGPGTGALLGDLDGNGLEDVLLLRGPESPRLLRQIGRGNFVEDADFVATGAAGGLLADLDLDGDLDVVLLGSSVEPTAPHRVLMNRGDGRFARAVPLGAGAERPAARAAVAADVDGDGVVELLVTRAGAVPQLWKTPPPRGVHWLEVLVAADATAGAAWTHPDAVGLQVEVKAGRSVQLRRLTTSSGYLSSPPLRACFGLGMHAKADYVRFVWPDAVLQSELEVPADQAWRVGKVVRKPSSCPLLFSWDGERFRFVTDFLGVGGLGFFVAPGEYAPPDPTEDVRIPPELVAVRDGRYQLRIAEPLEEVSYLDQLELRVYDHPTAVELYPDERYAGSPPWPTGRPFAVKEKLFPVDARTDSGEPVLDRLLEIDRRYVEPPKDPRFPGYAREHVLELDFGDRLQGRPAGSRVILCLYGWVEYTFSHVNFGAYQAGLRLQPPSIEVPDGRGGWRTVLADAGFPAGLPRMMTLDITGLGSGEIGRFRIRTNMEIYWDQIFAAEDAAAEPRAPHVLRPVVAELRTLGYPREYSPDGRDPTVYDYHRIDRGVAFRNLTGDYTRFGDVRALLESVDDRFVIFGKGEEIAVEFDASALPTLAEGFTRTVVLHADGYCKDMDLYTATPDTVEPLPYHDMASYPPVAPTPRSESEQDYRRRWNTRRVAGPRD